LDGPFDGTRTAELFEASDLVMAPYLESYGSGIVLLGMSFGKLVLATRAGGTDEYFARYPAGITIADPGPAAINQGFREALRRLPPPNAPLADGPPELIWERIIARTMPVLRGKLGFES